jgi:hypothetical protein
MGRNFNARLLIVDSFAPHEYRTTNTNTASPTTSTMATITAMINKGIATVTGPHVSGAGTGSTADVEWPVPSSDMISLSSSGGGLRSYAQWLVWFARCNYRLIHTTSPLDHVNLHIMEAVPIAASAPVL